MLSLASSSKLIRLGVPPALVTRLSQPPSVLSGGASPGALQPGAAPTSSAERSEHARNTHLEALAPAFSVRLFLALREAHAKGVSVGFFEGLRTAERQLWLYSEGRTRPGLIVTNARTVYNSWHGYGLAADIVPIRHDSWIWPSTGDSIWEQWLQIALNHGLTTGLRWKFTDAPHTQPVYINSYPESKDQLALRSFGIQRIWEAYDQFSLSENYIARV